MTNRQLLSSYVPLRLAAQNQPGEIAGVLEVYSDVSPLVAQIERRQQLVFVISAAVWGCVYATLLLIVKRAERIMRRQYIAQQRTAEALRHSEQKAHQHAEELSQAFQDLEASQTEQLIQAEKMASLDPS